MGGDTSTDTTASVSGGVFGSMLTIPPVLFSISLLIIIGAVILVEFFFHFLRHWTKDTPFHKMLLAVENELMIVGFTAFFFKIFVESTHFLTHDQHFALEFADLIVPIFSFTHCFLGLLLIFLTFRQNSLWSKAFHLTSAELLDSYYKESEAWHFRLTPQALNTPLLTIEFRLLHNIFCELFKIKRDAFDFDRYVELVFERFILSVIGLSPSNVLVLVIIVCLNMIRKSPSDIIAASSCVSSDFDCLNRQAIISFSIFGGILLVVTLLLAFVSRRYERLILSYRGIQSWQQYPEVLQHMEESSVGGLDEHDLKKALQKAKDLLFVEQEEQKKFYKDLLFLPFSILNNALHFSMKVKKQSAEYASNFASSKSVDNESLKVHPIDSLSQHINSDKISKDEINNNNEKDQILTDQNNDIIFQNGSIKTTDTTDSIPTSINDPSVVPKDIKGVIAFAQIKKKLVMLEQKAKERVAARKIESKKARRESGKTPTSNNRNNNDERNNNTNPIKVPKLQKLDSVKFKLDSKGRLHSTFKNVVGTLASTPTSFSKQFDFSIKNQHSIGSLVMGENRMTCEDDIESIFFLSRPYIFFECVHVLSMIISIYQATWFTNFVAINGSTDYKIISIIPFILCSLLFVYIVKSAALLQAIYRVDYECVLEVMEAMESSRNLGRTIREKLVAFCNLNIDELTKDSKELIKKLFIEIDDDGNGNLSRSEFAQFLNSLDIHFSKTKLKHLFTEIDLNFSNSISFEEFFIFIFPEHDEAKAIEKKRMSIVKRRVERRATVRAIEYNSKLQASTKKMSFSVSNSSMKPNNFVSRSNSNDAESLMANNNKISDDNNSNDVFETGEQVSSKNNFFSLVNVSMKLNRNNSNIITNDDHKPEEEEDGDQEEEVNKNFLGNSSKSKSFRNYFAPSISSGKSNNDVYNNDVQKTLGERENHLTEYQVEDI